MPSCVPVLVHCWQFWQQLSSTETVVRLPITLANAAAVSVILMLAVLGSVYIYKLYTQPKCTCPLCVGDYVIQRTLGCVKRLITTSCRVMHSWVAAVGRTTAVPHRLPCWLHATLLCCSRSVVHTTQERGVWVCVQGHTHTGREDVRAQKDSGHGHQ